MSKTVRSPDGHVKAADAVQLFVSITDADSPYTPANSNEYISVDSSGGAVSINFPVAGQGGIFTVNIAVGGSDVTFSGLASGTTINGASSQTITGGTPGAYSFRAVADSTGALGWRSI